MRRSTAEPAKEAGLLLSDVHELLVPAAAAGLLEAGRGRGGLQQPVHRAAHPAHAPAAIITPSDRWLFPELQAHAAAPQHFMTILAQGAPFDTIRPSR